MSKNRQRKKVNVHNAAAPPPYELHNAKSSFYHGAARFIEIAPPGIQFRGLTNVDHITSIAFSNHIESVTVVDEEAIPASDAGGDAIPEVSHMENSVTGFDVIVGIAGQQNEFTFSKLPLAIAYYNDLLNMIIAVGVPVALNMQRVVAPPPPEPEPEGVEAGIVGADGKPLEATNDDDTDVDDDDPLIEELEELMDEELIDEIDDEDILPTEH